MPARTRIYVDGFNLYYGAVRDTPYRWLNLRRMCELLLPEYAITKIKYFTARVSARRDDPDKPTRQQVYLRALRTDPDLEIIYGILLAHEVPMPLAEPLPGGSRFARVIKTEEKGSDVIRQIRKGVLAVSQFPDTLTDDKGAFHKPSAW